MKRSLFYLVILSFFILLNPAHNQAQKSDSTAKSKVSIGTVSPELREAYKRMNSLGFKMSKAAKEINIKLKGFENPKGWDARDIVEFYDELSEAVSRIKSLDEEAREAFTAFEKELRKASLPQVALEKHMSFVEKNSKNFSKFNNIYENIRLARPDLIKNLGSGGVLKSKLDRDTAARIGIKASLIQLSELFNDWNGTKASPILRLTRTHHHRGAMFT